MRKMVVINIHREHALRIAVGIMALLLVMAGEAGATKFIRNDATGGDCISFGTWNGATMTCTMTTDLFEGIQVDSNGVTLDGNGHTITGNGGGGTVGVFLSGRSGVTIKNINTKNNAIGIDLVSSNNNILSGNNATSNSNSGINMASSSNNILSNNNANNNSYGISMGNSNNNILSSNNFSNERIGIYMSGSSYNTLNSNNASNNIATGYASIYLTSSSNSTLSNNNASNNSGGGIYLSQSSNSTLSGNNASNNDFGITLSTSSDSMLSGNTANSNKEHGINLYASSNKNTLSNNNANSNNGDGIYLTTSNNMLSNNNANSNNKYGIHLYSGSNKNTLSNNNANSNNLYYGIYLDQTNNNTLSGNNASKNNYGIYLSNSRDNTLKGNNASSNYNTGIYLKSTPPYSYRNNIYNNYFNNTINYGSTTGNATWNTTRTSATNIIGGPYLGGNFWANPAGTGFSQTCTDIDNDGICDLQYNLSGSNIDYLPLSKNFTKTSSITVISPNGGENWQAGTTKTIKWNYTGSPGSYVKIELMKGIANTSINSNVSLGSSGSGSYNWLINSTQTPGTDYKVRITSKTNPMYNDTSNNNFTISAPTPYTISLKSGWNLISVPLDLTTWILGDESAVGNPLNVTPANCLSSIYRYNTTSALFEKSDHFTDWGWYPATGSESFTALEPGRGYWVMAQQDCSLTFTGAAPSHLDIPLYTGWNLIGWYSINEAPLGEEAAAGNPLNVTPANSLTSIYRYNTASALFEKSDHFDDWGWWSATGSESFTEIEPGKGYWVNAKNVAVWRHES
jgi:parallel beta-helix repeat protein